MPQVIFRSAEWRVLSAEIRRRGVVSLLSTEDSVLRTDKVCGRSSVVEFQPSKLAVRGSNPLARSIWSQCKVKSAK